MLLGRIPRSNEFGGHGDKRAHLPSPSASLSRPRPGRPPHWSLLVSYSFHLRTFVPIPSSVCNPLCSNFTSSRLFLDHRIENSPPHSYHLVLLYSVAHFTTRYYIYFPFACCLTSLLESSFQRRGICLSVCCCSPGPRTVPGTS